MKAEKKAERLAALFGLEAPKPPTDTEVRNATTASREAEATILYFEDRTKFIERMCRICERVFAVNRSNIAFCSDDCRAVHIREVVGIDDWNPTGRSPEERWSYQTGGREPLIVPPAVLHRLKQSWLGQQGQEPAPLTADDSLAG